MPLFNVYLIVDWSSRSVPSPARPSADSVWLCVAANQGENPIATETYFRTRHACIEHVRERLITLVEAGQRVLVGFDFPYGYPTGFAEMIGAEDPAPWRSTWNTLSELIDDRPDNHNNRFDVASLLNAHCGDGPGPFWACPADRQTEALHSKSPGFPYRNLSRLRHTERSIKGVQETWKLGGAGSVGSQALVGIPAVARLRDDPRLTAVSAVWPFETGFTATPVPDSGPFVLHAEIWPGVVNQPHGIPLPLGKATPEWVKDRGQVHDLASLFARLDARDAFGPYFDPPAARLHADTCVQEEGWILGAGMTTR